MKQNEPGIPGTGTFVKYTIADPAVATDFTVTVPAGQFWRLINIKFYIDTDANGANRRIIIFSPDSGTGEWSICGSEAVVANEIWAVNFEFPGGGSVSRKAGDVYNQAAGMNLYLNAGDKIQSNILNIQAGDQISDVVITIERWAVA